MYMCNIVILKNSLKSSGQLHSKSNDPLGFLQASTLSPGICVRTGEAQGPFRAI